MERVWIDQMIVVEWTLCREDTGYFGTYNCRASLGPATERWRSSGENEEIHDRGSLCFVEPQKS